MAVNHPCYIPGEVNINVEEARMRRETAFFMLVITIALTAYLDISESPVWSLVLVIPFIWYGVLSALQSFTKFCVHFALKGIQNAKRTHDDPIPIASDAARRADRVRAIRMMVVSLVISLFLFGVLVAFIR